MIGWTIVVGYTINRMLGRLATSPSTLLTLGSSTFEFPWTPGGALGFSPSRYVCTLINQNMKLSHRNVSFGASLHYKGHTHPNGMMLLRMRFILKGQDVNISNLLKKS
jgi:hypothetical protein